MEAIPTLIRLIQGEVTLVEALAELGPRLLTSGIVTVMVLLFPPVGVAVGAAIVTAVSTAGIGLAILGAGILGYQIWENSDRQERLKAMQLASSPSPSWMGNSQSISQLLDQLLM